GQDFGQRDQRPERLRFEWLVKCGQGGLGAGFADGGEMGVDDRGVEGLVSQVLADLAQRDTFLQQVCRVAVAQRLLILLINCLRAESNIATTRATARKS